MTIYISASLLPRSKWKNGNKKCFKCEHECSHYTCVVMNCEHRPWAADQSNCTVQASSQLQLMSLWCKRDHVPWFLCLLQRNKPDHDSIKTKMRGLSSETVSHYCRSSAFRRDRVGWRGRYSVLKTIFFRSRLLSDKGQPHRGVVAKLEAHTYFCHCINSHWSSQRGTALFLMGVLHTGAGIQQRVLLFLHLGGPLALPLTELNCSREIQKESWKMPSCMEHNAHLQQTELDKVPAAGSTAIYCFQGKSSKIATNCLKCISPHLSWVSVSLAMKQKRRLLFPKPRFSFLGVQCLPRFHVKERA